MESKRKFQVNKTELEGNSNEIEGEVQLTAFPELRDGLACFMGWASRKTEVQSSDIITHLSRLLSPPNQS